MPPWRVSWFVANDEPVSTSPSPSPIWKSPEIGFNSGPPMMPIGYNNNMPLFQTPDHVVILNEMMRDARIIPLDGRPHLPGSVRQWMGDSRRRWESDTLVVETTILTKFTGSFDPSAMQAIGTGLTVTLTERFTRPFTVAVPMRRNDEPLFEYYCHEGNYGLLNILSGARTEEAESQPLNAVRRSTRGAGCGPLVARQSRPARPDPWPSRPRRRPGFPGRE